MWTRSVSLMVGLLLLGCGSARKSGDSQQTTFPRPLMLLVEQELAGQILGQKLKEPFGLAVDNYGILYVADAGNNRIVRIDLVNGLRQEIGGYGNAPGLFDQPNFLVIDNGLNLRISDTGNRRIARYNNKLNYVDEIKLVDDTDLLKYGRCSGVAVTDYGEVWLSDRDNNRIAVFDNVGQFDRFIGEFGYSGGQLSSPEKIVYDGQGKFGVCDAGNGRIVVYDDYGNYSHHFQDDGLDYPIALVIDKSRRYWVLDHTNGRLFCFSKKGQLLIETGPQIPGTDSPLRNPSDIATLSDGRLVIADTGNNRLLICRILHEES